MTTTWVINSRDKLLVALYNHTGRTRSTVGSTELMEAIEEYIDARLQDMNEDILDRIDRSGRWDPHY
jgi:hypothetical protein